MSSEGLESVSYPSTKGDAAREQAKSVPSGGEGARDGLSGGVCGVFSAPVFLVDRGVDQESRRFVRPDWTVVCELQFMVKLATAVEPP